MRYACGLNALLIGASLTSCGAEINQRNASTQPHVAIGARSTPAAPAAPGTAAANATATATTISPYLIVARRKGGLVLSPVAASGRSRFAFLGNAIVEVFGDSVKMRKDLLAGLDSFPPNSVLYLDQMAGSWPDQLFLHAHNSFVGDVFSWQHDHWKPRHPKRLQVASGGYMEGWMMAPWAKDSLLGLKRMLRFSEWKVLSGKGGALPHIEDVGPPCFKALQPVDDAVWQTNGDVVAVGTSCRNEEAPRKLVAFHWKGAKAPVVVELPDTLGVASAQLHLVSLDASQLYALGNAWKDSKRTENYLAHYDGSSWRRLKLPAIQGAVQGHAPGDGKLYVTGGGSLWVREEAGGWQQIALPTDKSAPSKSPMHIDGMWIVDGAMWIAASYGRDKHIVLHSGRATVPTDSEVAAAVAELFNRPAKN